MSKITCATPIRLWGGCSEEEFLSVCSEATPNGVVERLYGKRCDNLKYFEFDFPKYEHVITATRKYGEFVQETPFFMGGNIR